MHPALSVIFFTTIGGAGYGLLFLLGLQLLLAPPLDRSAVIPIALTGGLLASAGLVASLWHLGQPQRAWRALSQWRSSWLSREAVVALFGYLPLTACIALTWTDADPRWLRLAGGALALAAAATVWCTARIYTSLPPIPAWRLRPVLPGYIGFALLSGLLWWQALAFVLDLPRAPAVALAAAGLGLGMLVLKLGYWRAIDRQTLPADLPTATGLSGASGMRPFEAPHTETSYLLREMGHVLARRHAVPLRRASLLLLALGAGLAAVAAGLPAGAVALSWLSLVMLHAGLFVERWLFFAQARHVVTVYYRG